MDIGAAVVRAGGAAASRIKRLQVLREPRIANIDRTVSREGLAGASRTRRQHAVEHVDAAHARADAVLGFADTHQVARLFGWHLARYVVQRSKRRFLALAYC